MTIWLVLVYSIVICDGSEAVQWQFPHRGEPDEPPELWWAIKAGLRTGTEWKEELNIDIYIYIYINYLYIFI